MKQHQPPALRIDTSKRSCLGNPPDTNDIGGQPHVNVFPSSGLAHIAIGVYHYCFHLGVHFLFLPEEELKVLHPFKIGDYNASGIR